MRTLIKHLLAATEAHQGATVKGWIRTRRDSKGFSFLELNDGSCLAGLQCVVDAAAPGYADIAQFTTGASAVVEGDLVASPASGQKWELRATRIELVGPADAAYPLQKKGPTLEFLRSIAHLRPRSNLFGAVFRTRSRLAFAVHEFFQSRDFTCMCTRRLSRRATARVRAAVMLVLEEPSYEEIASVTGLTAGNVSVRLVRAKDRLRRLMGGRAAAGETHHV